MQLSGVTSNLFYQGVKSALNQLLGRIDTLEKQILEHKQALMNYLDPEAKELGFSTKPKSRFNGFNN